MSVTGKIRAHFAKSSNKLIFIFESSKELHDCNQHLVKELEGGIKNLASEDMLMDKFIAKIRYGMFSAVESQLESKTVPCWHKLQGQ